MEEILHRLEILERTLLAQAADARSLRETWKQTTLVQAVENHLKVLHNCLKDKQGEPWDAIRASALGVENALKRSEEPPGRPVASVLVVDDDPVTQKVVSRHLSQMGHAVDTASSGAEALETLEKKPYEVVILDVNMPDLDGLETARRIRRRFVPGPYMIALTSSTSAADRRAVMEVGIHDYLPKPLKFEELADALAQVR